MDELSRTVSEVVAQYDNSRIFTSAAMSQVLRQQEMLRRFSSPLIEQLLRQQEMLRNVTSPLVAQIRMIQRQREKLAQSLEKVTAIVSNPQWKHVTALLCSDIERIRDQATRISRAYELIRPGLQTFAVLPCVVGMSHIHGTLKLADKWRQSGQSTDPLVSSIARTERHVAAQEEAILDYPTAFRLGDLDEENDEGLAILPTLNSFHIQRSDLILIARKSPDDLKNEELLDSLPSFECSKRAVAICELVVLINQQRTARGEAEIFKPTSQLIRALVALPNLITVSREYFGQFIDHLYFVLYESAGKDNLRFLGLIDDTSAKPVWAVKHFRNFDFRHDVEHGKPRDIEKKQVSLGEEYSQLIGLRVPRTRRDFRQAQLMLLRAVEAMLREISDAIQALPESDASDLR